MATQNGVMGAVQMGAMEGGQRSGLQRSEARAEGIIGSVQTIVITPQAMSIGVGLPGTTTHFMDFPIGARIDEVRRDAGRVFKLTLVNTVYLLDADDPQVCWILDDRVRLRRHLDLFVGRRYFFLPRPGWTPPSEMEVKEIHDPKERRGDSSDQRGGWSGQNWRGGSGRADSQAGSGPVQTYPYAPMSVSGPEVQAQPPPEQVQAPPPSTLARCPGAVWSKELADWLGGASAKRPTIRQTFGPALTANIFGVAIGQNISVRGCFDALSKAVRLHLESQVRQSNLAGRVQDSVGFIHQMNSMRVVECIKGETGLGKSAILPLLLSEAVHFVTDLRGRLGVGGAVSSSQPSLPIRVIYATSSSYAIVERNGTSWQPIDLSAAARSQPAVIIVCLDGVTASSDLKWKSLIPLDWAVLFAVCRPNATDFLRSLRPGASCVVQVLPEFEPSEFSEFIRTSATDRILNSIEAGTGDFADHPTFLRLVRFVGESPRSRLVVTGLVPAFWFDPLSFLSRVEEALLSGEDDGVVTRAVQVDGGVIHVPTSEFTAALARAWVRRRVGANQEALDSLCELVRCKGLAGFCYEEFVFQRVVAGTSQIEDIQGGLLPLQFSSSQASCFGSFDELTTRAKEGLKGELGAWRGLGVQRARVPFQPVFDFVAFSAIRSESEQRMLVFVRASRTPFETIVPECTAFQEFAAEMIDAGVDVVYLTVLPQGALRGEIREAGSVPSAVGIVRWPSLGYL